MHTMMHIQTFWKITGASFKLHESEYIISWPLHDLSFTLNEKIALKSSENKIKICSYLVNLHNLVFFQSGNSNCCKKIWISARLVMAHLKTDNFLVVKFSQNIICNVQQPWLIGETLSIFMAHFILNSYPHWGLSLFKIASNPIPTAHIWVSRDNRR